jgi:hypothetical protein
MIVCSDALERRLFMRFGKLTLALLGFAAMLCAADPYVGTWKMNAAKGKFTKGEPSKEQTLVITEKGNDISVKINGTASDGTKQEFAYSVPSKGGPGKIESGTAYDGVVGKSVSPNERDMSYLKGGKTVYTAHSKVSADGKSMTVQVKGTNAIGKPIEGTAVYDKQ